VTIYKDPRSAPAWELLTQHADELAAVTLSELLAAADRFDNFSAELEGLYVDFSRCRATTRTLELLTELAGQLELEQHINDLFGGATVNVSENRAALHTSLRAQEEIPREVGAEQEHFLAFADAVRSGRHTGFGGAAIRRVVNIGIGGSDLGPRMLVAALGGQSGAGPDVEFVAGIDGTELSNALEGANPAATLFIVCSKTFSTLETRLNADSARAWLLQSLPADAVATNFAAVSANVDAPIEFGIAQDSCFRIWDWVGGRYSLWSAVGLAAAIRIGSEAFRELLAGGASMDRHFRTSEPGHNIPCLLALLGIWNRNFLGMEHHVVLPYDQRLEKLPAYLQQLFMESEGKAVRQDLAPVDYQTGAALWGGAGSSAQHSYAQWLHQGTAFAHTDFIATVNGADSSPPEAVLQSLANVLAQAEALAHGHSDAALPFKAHPGNRSSLVILLRELNPHNLGLLVALYEHVVFVQSMIWGINPFDQWGVELGKLGARQIAATLTAGEGAPGSDLPPLGKQILKWRGPA
jgi:glucose-6-phosphate isomerase